MRQLITPNPNIPCKPGWCLAYVNEAYGVPKRYGTATAAWDASPTKHTGRDVPAGVWTPVWYALANEPAGHVALHAPDGSVYSTSDLTSIPHHHPNLADLEAYYAYYGMTLTWRGWTEDVEGTPVIDPGSIATESATITPLEDPMPTAKEIAEAVLLYPINREGSFGGTTCLKAVIAWYDAGIATTIAGAVKGANAAGGGSDPDAIAAAVTAAVQGVAQDALKGSTITFTAGQ